LRGFLQNILRFVPMYSHPSFNFNRLNLGSQIYCTFEAFRVLPDVRQTTIMIRFFVAFFLVFIYRGSANAQESWNLISEKDGIKVFSKSVPTSKIKAVKVECVINSSASQLVSLLLDLPVAKDWVSHTKSCVLVKKVSGSEVYYYSEVSLPWPLENRDFVAHIKVTQDPSTKVVTVNAPAVPGWVAKKKGIVRITHSIGHWVITPLEPNRVKVEYTLQVDPGGIIPAWTVNMLAAQGPTESFKNMRRQLLLPRYKNVNLPFIIN
jgi:hypothetical protein